MIGTTALTAALTFGQVPQPVELPVGLEPERIEVTLQTTSNHFSAANDSFLDQLLVFGCDELGRFASLRLDPGGRVLYPFPRGGAEDLWVEVVALDGALWRNTGALSLDVVRDSYDSTLWVQDADDTSLAWVQSPRGLMHLTPEFSLCDGVLRAAHPELRDGGFAAPLHVPTPMPTKDEKEGPPPVLDKKPLPPV